MKRAILLSVLAVLFAFALPLLFTVSPGTGADPAEPSPAAPTETPQQAISQSPVLDSGILLTVHTENGDAKMTMADYLPLALAGEMPASFDEEALKAQAVALRSYALYYRENRKSSHPDADVCTSAGCCAAFADAAALHETWGEGYDAYYSKLCAAVSATDGQYLVWENAPILAVFHSSSLGQTEDGADLGTVRPYLVSVSSPETAESVTNLCTTVEVSAAEFQATVLSVCPDAMLDGEPADWVGAVTLNAAGRVGSVEIGGVCVSGLALRQMFALRSTDFTLAWSDGSFRFRVNGYGHGLGMSQYGANLMAKAGDDYAEILSHYYPGTELVMAVRGT